MTGEEVPQLRIGELSRRVDVPPTLLRAWERRYSLLKPTRSEGNFRLYSLDDVARVWAMKAHLERGHAAAEAAQLALAERSSDPATALATAEAAPAVQELREALI